MWILNFVKPRIAIDGDEYQGRWKESATVPVAPGTHVVATYFPYIFWKRAGVGEVTVNVADGQVVDVRYEAPWLVFLKGKMSID